MNTARKAYFSGSWYPGSASEVKKQLIKWDTSLAPFEKNIHSGIVPHAGWFFSGMMAYDVIRRFSSDIDLLFVLGGHLPENGPILYPVESSCETPCGNLPIDREALKYLQDKHSLETEKGIDNTIEVQLPLIRAVLGEISIVPLRVPSGPLSLALTESILEYSEIKKMKSAVLGSTDLTHYGSNYNHSPPDSKTDPLGWVKMTDAKILQAMIDLKPELVLEEAQANQSACSAGAAAAAALFAKRKGVEKGNLLSYETSYTKHQSESFVAYGSLVYEI